MQIIAEKQLCSGCHACYNVCPKRCITMDADKEGFLYPTINSNECVECGKCRKVCPVLNRRNTNPKGCAYACINKKENIRRQSSSGGVFTLIAEYVLRQGGVVFGVAYDRDLCVRHIEVMRSSELEKLRGSKYLQSTIGDAYVNVKKYLNNGTMVLFTGTPCQISGLKSFLGRDYEILLTQDIICHGVPSQSVWQKYLGYLSTLNNAEVNKSFAPLFREKSTGWRTYSISVFFENNRRYTRDAREDLYMKAFLNDLSLRPSCYNCRSKSCERESDITLGDFWGIENIAPDMFDDKGTSLVLINSVKGRNIFDKISDNMIYKEVDIDNALQYNPSAYQACKKSRKRDLFMNEVTKNNFDKKVRKYTKKSLYKKVFSRLKRILKGKCDKSYV